MHANGRVAFRRLSGFAGPHGRGHPTAWPTTYCATTLVKSAGMRTLVDAIACEM